MRPIIALALRELFLLQTTASSAIQSWLRRPNVLPLLSARENTFVFTIARHFDVAARLVGRAQTPNRGA